MKKLLSLVLTVTLVSSILAGCSKAADAPTPAAETGTVDAPVTEAAPPEESIQEKTNDFDADRIIGVFTREDGSGTRDAFVSITGVGDDMYGEAAVKTETNEIISGVEGNEYAIGYVSLGSLNDKIKALNIDGVIPSSETIKNGSYPIQRPFLVCVNDENKDNELVQDFISFMVSIEGQELAASKWITAIDNAQSYAPSGLSGTLKVGGSTSVDPLMVIMKDKYISLNPDVSIEISGGGSGTGISEAASGVIDIGMSSRGLKESEYEGLTDYIIALDGVAVIININNPAENMAMEMVKDIFTGAVTKWADAN